MNEFHIRNVPDDCIVRGLIYESANPDDLSEDMLEIELPNGILIQCGWEQRADQRGEYVIAATRGLSFIAGPVATKTAQVAVAVVQAFAGALRMHVVPPRRAGIIEKKELVAV